MDFKTSEIIIAAEGVVTIPINEYSSLIACRTLLDMVLSSKGEYGYCDSVVLRCADEQRKLHLDMLMMRSMDFESPKGERDA